jgi:molecular chaperone DnaK (HSP70)
MEKFKDLPIGIDLGTTFSCIGVYRNKTVEIIPNEKGDRVTPSVVSFLDDDIFVGEQTEYKRVKDPKNKIYAVKRIIGRNFNDKEVQQDIKKFTYTVQNDNNRPQIIVDSNGIRRYSPEEISAKILSKLKKSAEEFLGQEIKKVVITVPAYFTERQKQATKNAGEIAGLEVIKIINEPTAASLAYGFGICLNSEKKILGQNILFDDDILNSFRAPNINELRKKTFKKETENILIFDLGGGTLDVTLLELEEDDITVKSHSGKMHLGGEDFDNILVHYCIDMFKKQTRIDLNQEEFRKQRLRLKKHCENAKIDLSYKMETEIEIESLANEKDFNLKLTRAKFEELCKNIFKVCKEPINEVLKNANEDKENIDEIVLVGGSTRIPKIQEILKDYFNGKELNRKLNPDEAVAYGATIQAAISMGNYKNDITLLDVCPFSLGVAFREEKYYNENGLSMKTIIKKGTSLPCRKTVEKFHPANNYCTSILIQIYEGENRFVKDNYLLGKFELINIPKKKRDEINIEVTFELDEDSILTVKAMVKENNISNSIVIKNDKGGLSKNEIEEAKQRQEKETCTGDLPPATILEKNYKKEINELIEKINNTLNKEDQLHYLQQLSSTIEMFIDNFSKDNPDNYTFLEKMHYYLTYLFTTYSLILRFENLVNHIEKETIILKISEYLNFFEKRATSFCLPLVKIFINNGDEIFGQFCTQILGFYCQRGYDLYTSNEKKYAKHYLEEALSINQKYSVKDKVKNNSEISNNLNSIIENCKDLINRLKAESIQKYCKSFSTTNLIDENEFTTLEEKLDILDRFKEALSLLNDAKKREDKLLKSIYLGNIIKMEYKIFNSNNYDALLKMIDSCINLKVLCPEGCETPFLDWFDEICKYKLEIEEKKEKGGDKDTVKEDSKSIIEKINDKFKEGKIPFLFYILTQHKPNGLEDELKFDNEEQLKNLYKENGKKFMKRLRKLYNPMRYKGDKEGQIHYIMQEISIKLSDLN